MAKTKKNRNNKDDGPVPFQDYFESVDHQPPVDELFDKRGDEDENHRKRLRAILAH